VLVDAIVELLLGAFLGSSLTSLEALDAAGRIETLFIAGVKRMAGAANFHVDFLLRGSYFKSISAGALRRCLRIIGWVNIGFHGRIMTEN